MNAALKPELVGHYEQLRKDALSFSAGRASTPGLALFLRQGMTAWMRAWTPCLQKPCAETLFPSAIIRRTDGHNVSVEHHERQPPITFQRVL